MKRGSPYPTLLLAAAIAALGIATAPPAGAARQPKPLTVLVTNDDGVGAPGIDAVVEALRRQRNTEVVVVAPATNQSGSGGKYTAGGAPGAPATTKTGYQATAVDGFPADTIDYALDVLKVKPDVVISGANSGQNLGEIADVSGTVGAARQAARRGIPALAVSQGMGTANFPTGAQLTVDWLNQHRRALAKRKATGKPLTEIDSLNVPNCPGGVRGIADTVPAPVGTPDLVLGTSNCASTQTTFANDADAFNNGYAAFTTVSVPAERG